MEVNGFNSYIQNMANRSLLSQEIHEGDRYDDEGLLICGKCGMRKQAFVDMPDPENPSTNQMIKTKVAITCQCDIERQNEERKEKAAALIRIARAGSMMNPKYAEASFSAYEENKYNARNLKLAKRYVEKFHELAEAGQGLLFWGDVGTGKSYTAACIANALIDKTVKIVMTSFAQLLSFGVGDDDDVSRRIDMARLVIFDDLGAERDTGYALEKVYHYIDRRVSIGKPMILTTNLTLKQMMDETDTRYKRIYDRIFEVCYPVQFTGPSFRKRVAKDRFEQMQKLLVLDD